MFRIALPAALGLALVASSAPLAQSSGAEEVLRPGYWRYQSRAAMGLLNDTDFRCVRPQDRAKFLEPCNRHNTCTYHVKELANGRARLEGVWVDKGDGKRIRVSAQGTYSEQRFQLNATIRDVVPAIGISGTITATWQSDVCPAGARNP